MISVSLSLIKTQRGWLFWIVRTSILSHFTWLLEISENWSCNFLLQPGVLEAIFIKLHQLDLYKQKEHFIVWRGLSENFFNFFLEQFITHLNCELFTIVLIAFQSSSHLITFLQILSPFQICTNGYLWKRCWLKRILFFWGGVQSCFFKSDTSIKHLQRNGKNDWGKLQWIYDGP